LFTGKIRLSLSLGILTFTVSRNWNLSLIRCSSFPIREHEMF